jgi:ATP-dependent DNA helicase RecG
MIESLLSENEGKTLEFKESTKSLMGIVKTVVAFANTAGGTIVIGVKDGTKEIVGLSDALMEEEKVANAIADSIAPLLTPDIEIQTIRNKELIIIRIAHGVGPFHIKSEGLEKGTYIRFGSTNRIVDHETLDSLRLLAKKIYFDELPNPRGKLHHGSIIKAFDQINKRSNDHTLENLGITAIHSGKVMSTNGGILLFGENRMKLFPDSLIRCGRFKGTTKEKILDQLDIEEPLPFAIDIITGFIERNVRKEGRIGRIYREDILEYPPAAIREAVVNALLHTDYAMTGCNIQIAIFDDRIEFWNPGGLPFGQTIERAISGSSRIRNRVIARVFRELKIIEQWGSGLKKILETCKKQGLKTPSIEELNNQFRLTLYSSQVEEIIIEPWGRMLLYYLKDNESITSTGAGKFWNVSNRTARHRLKQLQEEGFIVRIGTSDTDPNASYILAKKIY